MLPKARNKYSINTVIKYYEHMIQGYHFNLASISKNSVLTILKSTQVSKAAALDSLFGHFLKDVATFLAKPISDLSNLLINSEKYCDLCKVAKLKPLSKKVSLSQPCYYRPISLLPLISKVIKRVIHDQTNTFQNLKNVLYTYQEWFSKKAFYGFLCFLFE